MAKIPRVLNPTQRQRFQTIRQNRGVDAARTYRQGIAGQAQTPTPQVPRLLNDNQRQRFQTIRTNRGMEAADAFRNRVADRAGVAAAGQGASAGVTGLNPWQQRRYNQLSGLNPDRAAAFLQKRGGSVIPPADDAAGIENLPLPNMPADPAVSPGMSEDNFRMLFPMGTTLDNYEASPLYKWALEQGQGELKKRMAASGLTGSGAEIEAGNRLNSALIAQEAERARSMSETQADRLERMLQNESLSQERAGNENWSRMRDVLSMGLGQNPAQLGYQASETQAGIKKSLADQISQILSQAYPRGGGGGGGGSEMPFVIPYPSSPDYTAADIMDVFGNAGTGTDYGNAVIQALPYFFG